MRAPRRERRSRASDSPGTRRSRMLHAARFAEKRPRMSAGAELATGPRPSRPRTRSRSPRRSAVAARIGTSELGRSPGPHRRATSRRGECSSAHRQFAQYAANGVLGARAHLTAARTKERFFASQVTARGPIVAPWNTPTVPILQQPDPRELRKGSDFLDSGEWAIQDSNLGPLPYQGRSEATSSRLQSSKMLQTARFSGMRGDLRRLQLTI